MFYCEDCRVKKDWPVSVMNSMGACEICGEAAECYDRPSRSLPLPKSSYAMPTPKKKRVCRFRNRKPNTVTSRRRMGVVC